MENRKDQIVEAASKRFAHFGFHKTTMNEIADDLRITKANLYYYYPDKSSLILDVLCTIISDLQEQEKKIIGKYKGDLLKSIYQILELKTSFMRKYYVFHINENLDWIKGLNIAETMDTYYKKEVNLFKGLLQQAKDAGELQMDNLDEAAVAFTEIQKGLSLMHTMTDVITGIPNQGNVDKILACQKRAAKLIFGTVTKSSN